ncbi:transcription elongation factor, mitochondrial [Python bivittatus]|uniref:Transcription elongation factor, mitochondrial n=1 Tax=Python bivittatus TaxID=176946 RepID=A0A9F2MXE2_PYTBI|nr:transcription elongation factor, mitochondrial [Python bivittatus]
MSVKRLPGLFWGGRKCFLQVLLTSSQGLLYHKKSTSVVKQISPSATEAKHAIDDLFSSEQQSVILQFLNSASEEELSAVKLLQGKRSFNIIGYRNKHGPFQELQTLLQVPFFQYKTAVKVCNFILKPLEKEEKKTCSPVSGMKCISPAIEKKRLKTANSIVSIVFGMHKISWAHVNRELVVQNWHLEIYKNKEETFTPAMYFTTISTIISTIPEADFYVLEKIGLPPTHAALFPVTLHLRIMEAVLYALLQKRFGEDGQHKVLSMARNAVGRYFGLMLGDVRISGIDLVKQFLLDSVTQTSRVSFTNNVATRHMHIVSGNIWKREEELCDSLLQAIAFYELLILNTNENS